jgi:hypothetical protein
VIWSVSSGTRNDNDFRCVSSLDLRLHPSDQIRESVEETGDEASVVDHDGERDEQEIQRDEEIWRDAKHDGEEIQRDEEIRHDAKRGGEEIQRDEETRHEQHQYQVEKQVKQS